MVCSLQARTEAAIAPFSGFPALEPRFLARCTFFRTDEERSKGRVLDFGLSFGEFSAVRNSICTALYRDAVPHIPGQPVEELAGRIRRVVDTNTNSHHITPNRLLLQWLCAEAICAWTLVQVRYDRALAQRPADEIRVNEASSRILAQPRPAHVCSGKAMVLRDLANALTSSTGLRCWYVGGWLRGMGDPTPKDSNHAWNCFTFEGGVLIPADAALGVEAEFARRQKRKIANAGILPLYREAWELFLAGHFGFLKQPGQEHGSTDLATTRDNLQDLLFSEWAALPTGPLRSLAQLLEDDGKWP